MVRLGFIIGFIALTGILFSGLAAYRVHEQELTVERIALARAIDVHASLVHDAQQDFLIWENKRYLARPALARGDGPIGKFRLWARQFYHDLPETMRAQQPALVPEA